MQSFCFLLYGKVNQTRNFIQLLIRCKIFQEVMLENNFRAPLYRYINQQSRGCFSSPPNISRVVHILGIVDNEMFAHPCGPVIKKDLFACLQGQKFKDQKQL